jgi:hypothetical protein
MRRFLISLFGVISLSQALTQDTTWVQTFTFDSIHSRRSNFIFPNSLESKRFEKVLMYYKLKCSPLTTHDKYDCAEWDTGTFTKVYEHSGKYDSVRVDTTRYLMNYSKLSSLKYDPAPNFRADNYPRAEYYRENATLQVLHVTDGGKEQPYPFNLSQHGGVYQMLITASELNEAGVVAGEIQSLSLFVNSISDGSLLSPIIALKATAETSLASYHISGFTEVYNGSRKPSGLYPELMKGINEFLFYQPFTWNGTSNLIVEFRFQNNVSTSGIVSFDADVDLSSMSASYDALNGYMQFDGNDRALLELSDIDLGKEVTISFWAKGTGAAGKNTCIFDAYDEFNNRVIGLSFPWSNNELYFDAGESYRNDRISKLMTADEIDNTWNHWAFVKNSNTGQMVIYKNGAVWQSATGAKFPLGSVHRFVLGAGLEAGIYWKGKLDEFQLYNAALSQSAIQGLMNQKPTSAHPNWSNLLAYYDFDNQPWAIDRSSKNNLLMPSKKGMIRFDEYARTGWKYNKHRPRVAFGQGVVAGLKKDTVVYQAYLKEPLIVFEQMPVNRTLNIVNAFLAIEEGDEITYNTNGGIVSKIPFSGSQKIESEKVTYYHEPFEITTDIEIARYITPYGIGFDLGPNGFTWIYDVTDYQHLLKGKVDLSAHNDMELIDLKFAFIEGIPPRDVHKREPIWGNYKGYQYSDLDNDVYLKQTKVVLSDTSKMFKIKTRITGHGHNGSVNCCEWDSKDHSILVNGIERFNWEIWEETGCADNPNISQGGTWPYAREGWCPGDMVKEYDHELTPYVKPGDTVNLDYDIEDVPLDDLAQGGGQYLMAMDLISYSAPNFQHDAAIVDVLNPNNYEYYRKWNPTCQNPRIILQNTGEQALTKCIIRCWITYGDWLEFEWKGNLKFLEKEVVEIPVANVNWWNDYDKMQTFTAQVYAVEGSPDLDEYPKNNVKKVRFEAPETVSGPFFVWFTTNNRAFENEWRLEDGSGTVLYKRSNFANSTQYRDTFNLQPGCYSLVLEDSDHDGISFWASKLYQGESDGQFRIRKVGGATIETFPTDFGRYHRWNFTVGYTLGTKEQDLDHEIAIIPNPSNGECSIELSGYVSHQAQLQILDLTGREVFRDNMLTTSNFAESHIQLTNIPSGNYIVKITTGDRVYTSKLVKQ